MSTFTVNFMNRVSGWLHSSVVVVAADVAEAEKIAREAFDLVHGFTAAYTDPQTGVYVPTSGTPGYDSTSFTTAVAPVVAGDATPLGQAVAAAGAGPVPAGATSGQPVQADSARIAADAEAAAADAALAQAQARVAEAALAQDKANTAYSLPAPVVTPSMPSEVPAPYTPVQ